MEILTLERETEILRKLTDPTEYSLVGIGYGRAVYSSLKDNTVVKMAPFHGGGELQNANEADISLRGCPYVAKVLKKGVFLNVCEKVSPIPRDDPRIESSGVLENFKNWCGCQTEANKDARHQVGLNSKGEIVIYDYGIPCHATDRKAYSGDTWFFKIKTDEDKRNHILYVMIPELELVKGSDE